MEFAFVGIPMVFVLISAVELAVGMWQYETLAYSVRAGGQYVASKGAGCSTGSNTCGTTVGAITTYIAANAIGIPVSQLNVTLTTNSGAATPCNPISSCTSNTTTWPPSTNSDNQAGRLVTITGSFTLNSPIALYYPGATPVSFNAAKLEAVASQPLMY